MGVLHDPAGGRLAEDLGQPDDRQAVRGNQVGQHLPRADRRQLVDVAHEQQRRFARQGGEHGLHQGQIDHGHLVDDQQIARERALGVPAKAATGFRLQQAMQGLGFASGALAEAARGAPGRRRELNVHPVVGQTVQDRLDQRGLAGARTAGDHQELARKRGGKRGALTRRQTQRQLALDPGKMRFGMLDRPGGPAARECAQALRDLPLRLMDRGQEHACRAFDGVCDQAAGGDLHRQRRRDSGRIDAEQRRGTLGQLGLRQRAMTLLERVLEHVTEPGAQPKRRVRSNAEPFGQLIGGLKPDAADVAREPIRVLADRLDRAFAVSLEDACGAQWAEPVGMQEQHDIAHRALLAPGGRDPSGEAPPDTRHFAQALWLALDHVEHLIAERCDQLLGQGAADAFDHARSRDTPRCPRACSAAPRPWSGHGTAGRSSGWSATRHPRARPRPASPERTRRPRLSGRAARGA